MADLLLDVQSVPTTPSAGQAVIYVDTTSKLFSVKNDAGVVSSIGGYNYSVAAQTPAAATRTYITGSALTLSSEKLQVGTRLSWCFNLTKTAAGTAASTFDIAFGTTGTTADTARVSFTKPAGTAVADEAWVTIDCVIRTIGATGVAVGTFSLMHNLENTGHAIIPCVVVTTVSAGFDMTTATVVGVCITSGASDAITIEHCEGTFR